MHVSASLDTVLLLAIAVGVWVIALAGVNVL